MAIKEKKVKLSPILKYPGGKEKELKYILPNLPRGCACYYEPFVGAGAVYFALDSDNYYINDKSAELISLYNMVKEHNDEFFQSLNDINRSWILIGKLPKSRTKTLVWTYSAYKTGRLDEAQLDDAISEFVLKNAEDFNAILSQSLDAGTADFAQELKKSLVNKLVRMKKLEAQKGEITPNDITLNLECAFKNAFYMHLRYLYNNIESLDISAPFATAIYFFVREFCYASMFRYNRQGGFNVPYGGISYNKKSMLKKLQYFKSRQLKGQLNKTVIENMDFEEFFKAHKPKKDDFIFLDPPYDTEFSTYAQNEFGKKDQKRLARFLIRKCRANFMLVIKNTDFIRKLYPAGLETANGGCLHVGQFDKKYVVSFQERNDKEAQHLLITNYQIYAYGQRNDRSV